METAWESKAGPLRSIAGRRALVVGLGRTGVAVARALLASGVRVRVTDRSPDVALPSDLAALERCGETDLEHLLEDVDLVVPSPGVSASAPVLVQARRRGIRVVSELELAAGELELPVVAVTGTNGKSTTTELVAHILGGPSARVFAGGNLGTPLVEAVGGEWAVAVVEVSSFQLEWVEDFRPDVGILLNLSDDHLDRHGDFESYAATKARIFARQGPGDVALLARDDPRIASLAPTLRAHVATFGAGACAGDGAEVRHGRVLARLRGREGAFDLERCALFGPHNTENVMAAILATMAVGATDTAIQTGLDTFTPLPHRMQLVHEEGGVRFIDDSKGTNVGALMRSLEGLPDGRVVLIVGGLDKGGDFGVSRDLVGRKARRVVAYGRARSVIARSWEGAAPVVSHESFGDAVRAAMSAAEPGDTVLLSPACASFDQFRSYAERGDAFASIVRSSS